MKAVGENKRCSRCIEWKSIGEFGRNASTNDGFCAYCKSCVSSARKIEYIKHKANERRKNRYHSDSDYRAKICSNRRKYYSENKEKIKEQMKESSKRYRSKPETKEKIKEYGKQYRQRPGVRARMCENNKKSREKRRESAAQKRIEYRIKHEWMKAKLAELGVVV